MQSNVEDFLENAGLSDLDDLVSYLIHDPIAEVWDLFGCGESFERSPFASEFGYYMIFDYDHDLAVSFQLPFDAAGRLAGLGRVMLETRDRHLDGRILDRSTSEAIHAELIEDIIKAIPKLDRPLLEPDETHCLPNHRFLAASLAAASAQLFLLTPESATQTAWHSQRVNGI